MPTYGCLGWRCCWRRRPCRPDASPVVAAVMCRRRLPTRRARELAPLAGGDRAAPALVDLRTMAAIDLIRVREEHSRLIASIPTATPVPTEAPASVANRYLMDGQSSEAEQNVVADPGLGVWWFRQAGGDWTGRGMRDRNPYARLFYSPEFGNEHDSFVNGGIQERIGQMLVAQAVCCFRSWLPRPARCWRRSRNAWAGNWLPMSCR